MDNQSIYSKAGCFGGIPLWSPRCVSHVVHHWLEHSGVITYSLLKALAMELRLTISRYWRDPTNSSCSWSIMSYIQCICPNISSKECGRQFDYRFITQLNSTPSAVEAHEARIAMRTAVSQSGILGFFIVTIEPTIRRHFMCLSLSWCCICPCHCVVFVILVLLCLSWVHMFLSFP